MRQVIRGRSLSLLPIENFVGIQATMSHNIGLTAERLLLGLVSL